MMNSTWHHDSYRSRDSQCCRCVPVTEKEFPVNRIDASPGTVAEKLSTPYNATWRQALPSRKFGCNWKWRGPATPHNRYESLKPAKACIRSPRIPAGEIHRPPLGPTKCRRPDRSLAKDEATPKGKRRQRQLPLATTPVPFPAFWVSLQQLLVNRWVRLHGNRDSSGKPKTASPCERLYLPYVPASGSGTWHIPEWSSPLQS